MPARANWAIAGAGAISAVHLLSQECIALNRRNAQLEAQNAELLAACKAFHEWMVNDGTGPQDVLGLVEAAITSTEAKE